MNFYRECEYKDSCEALFQRYDESIKSLLPHVRIEHVGSSSIPGAISKGDLDIFVGVMPEELESSVIALKTLGFIEKVDTLRTTELCMLESTSEDVALQVVANGSQFEFFIEFREKLKSSEILLAQYNQLKLSCVGFSEELYRRRKSEFIEQVLRNS